MRASRWGSASPSGRRPERAERFGAAAAIAAILLTLAGDANASNRSGLIYVVVIWPVGILASFLLPIAIAVDIPLLVVSCSGGVPLAGRAGREAPRAREG